MSIDARIGFEALLAEAEREIETLDVGTAIRLHGSDNVVFVDLRDVRELGREGRVPGAFHMPRGMLEFWVHPDSPYFKKIFLEEKRFILFCNRGWRSALATREAQRIGLQRVCHVAGGFSAWADGGGPVERPERK